LCRKGTFLFCSYDQQQRYGEEGIDGLLRDKTREPDRAPPSTGVVAKVLALTCSVPPGGATPGTAQTSQCHEMAADHPRWTVQFTPTSASWLNAVEGFFSTTTRRKIRRDAFNSVAELQDAIERYIKAHNNTTKPFVWTASASAIFRKLAQIPAPSE